MGIYDYEAAFGAADMTGQAMRTALNQWQQLYYGAGQADEDPSQRIAYTVVEKLARAVFGELRLSTADQATAQLVAALEQLRPLAFSHALVEGECYLKPCPGPKGFQFAAVPRHNMLVFARAADGMPTDIGTAERSCRDNQYYTLLERRTVDGDGCLTIRNQLYRSVKQDQLGRQVSLQSHPEYRALAAEFRYPEPVGLGLVRVRTPMLNCVDGSQEGVAVYAAAAELIRNINRNEAQLNGEFERGQSRVFASRDLLTDQGLTGNLFVGLDEDPQSLGLTVYSPQLREGAYLARKQEYLRNVESLVDLRRGMLADANIEERTATEIASSVADFNLTVLQLQRMWQQAVNDAVGLCQVLARLYGLPEPRQLPALDWGNGVLYDEAVQWEQHLALVEKGLLKPELALGWRFGMKTDTPEELAAVREKLMP